HNLYKFPHKPIEFGVRSFNNNFSLGGSEQESMQFYHNMRYSDSRISYRIDGCSLQKEDDMEGAFEILAGSTLLDFYSVDFDEEIYISCDDKNRFEGGLFIAGEGGPTNITRAGEFNVILNGKILLVRKSECSKPNIALHELLHSLGFDHSSNKNNIMFNISNCGQVIGQDLLDLINELYVIPSQPDLTFEDVSASIKGKYLDVDVGIRNYGLRDSENFILVISSEGNLKSPLHIILLLKEN
ncbi:matrixin family metalloprotease, partial [Nanoarchaeota archaeon]